MFHIINGEIKEYNKEIYIQNNQMGIHVEYQGNRYKGVFFLYPYLDDNNKTIRYFAFDTAEQKILFQSALKISGVGPKTAFQIAHLPIETLQEAIKNLDYKVFEKIKGIGPKSAKKILFEMKGNINIADYQKLDIDEQLYKQIIKALKTLGYDKEQIKQQLDNYPEKITKENRDEVIRFIVKNI